MRVMRHQPQGRARLNLAHPAFGNKRPVFAYSAAQGLFDVDGEPLTSVGETTSPGYAGGLLRNTAGSGNRVDIPYNASPPSLGFTVVTGFFVNSLSSTARIFASSDTSLYTGIAIAVNASGVLELLTGNNSGTGPGNRKSAITSAGAITVGRYYSVTIVFRSLSSADIWINGIRQTVSLTGTAGSYNPGTGNAMIGAASANGSYFYGNSGASHIVVIDGIAPDAIARDLSTNPWQLFAAPEVEDEAQEAAAPTEITGSASTALAGLSLSSSGAVTNSGAMSAQLASDQLSFAGGVAEQPSGSFSSALTGVSFSAVGALLATGAMSSNLAGASAVFAGNVAFPASGDMAAPLEGARMNAYGFQGDAPPVPESRRYRPRILRRHFTN